MDIRKGIIKAFDPGAFRAKVWMEGSLSVYLEDLPVARNIAAAEMAAGRGCAVLFFDDANPDDSVVIAVWA